MEKQKQLTELKLREARLKLLQGQIHPHFLFNILNNLYSLVKKDTERSRKVILHISELLDYMLYECEKDRVPLVRELDFIRNYLDLERLRFAGKFNVSVDFHEQNNIFIAPLILFPFVENAFKHGLRNHPDGFVHIVVKHKENVMIFSVKNSVSKNSEDKYLQRESSGIGLRNIQERLDLIYQDAYDLKIIRNQESFKVKLIIYLNDERK